MQADPEYLRQYYRSLSDEALLEIDRSDLIPMAQKYYDAEIARRGLATASNVHPLPTPKEAPLQEEIGLDHEANGNPAWFADAAEVYSTVVRPGGREQEQLADTRQILDAAGIPSFLEIVELTPEEKTISGTHRWRLMVPKKHHPRAWSTLERDESNADFEAGWKAHLEACSDDELLSMEPRIVFCGLFDRIERVARAYEEEMVRRGLPLTAR
jgi:hypothetical protein